LKKDRVIVDTSIWIEFFRNPLSPEKKEVDVLLDDDRAVLVGIVLAELLQGTRSQKEFELIKSALTALPFYEVSTQGWIKTGATASQLRKQGITIPLSDCLIAALAIENGCRVYSLDPHFEKIDDLRRHRA